MFKLAFDIPASKTKVNLRDKIFLMGSCFSTEIGERFDQNKFDTLHNPFGTIYNPYSIFKILRGELDASNLIESQHVFYHWDCHGEVSGLSEAETSEKVSSQLKRTKAFISDSKWLILTLGTSFVYKHKASGEIVANCHKVPSSEFTKELMSVSEIVSAFEKTYALLGLKEGFEVILTVSPVRHVRDGLAENNLSKAVLLQAAHEIAANFQGVSYFPSYEIVLDELRDYRFFKKDLVHPTDEAVDYVWKKFAQGYFDEETLSFLERWESIKTAIQHKPFQVKSQSHQQFLKETIRKLDELKDVVDIRMEKEALERQLA